MTQIIEEETFSDADAADKGPYDQFILLGDSITQQSSSQELGFGFQPALQNAFIRRLDIINRGFSGYNTSQVLRLLPSFMPKPSQAHIRFMLILLGANDACLPTSSTNQHVPLPLYAQNLRSILLHPSLHPHIHPPPSSSTSSTSSHNPPKLILCNPPPLDEYQQEDLNAEVQRTAATTKRYADACLAVGRAMPGVACLDLWGVMMRKAGWEGKEGEELVGSKKRERSEVLGELLQDGLHFNPAAYKILYEATMDLIKEKWPEEYPDNVAYVHPRWMFAPR